MLTVVGIDVVGQEALDGAEKLTIEPVDEQTLEYGSFKQKVVLSCRRGRCARRRGDRIPGFLLSLGFRGGIFVRRGIWKRNRRGLKGLQQFGNLSGIDLGCRGPRRCGLGFMTWRESRCL